MLGTASSLTIVPASPYAAQSTFVCPTEATPDTSFVCNVTVRDALKNPRYSDNRTVTNAGLLLGASVLTAGTVTPTSAIGVYEASYLAPSTLNTAVQLLISVNLGAKLVGGTNPQAVTVASQPISLSASSFACYAEAPAGSTVQCTMTLKLVTGAMFNGTCCPLHFSKRSE